MKKKISVLLALAMVMFTIAGCTSDNGQEDANENPQDTNQVEESNGAAKETSEEITGGILEAEFSIEINGNPFTQEDVSELEYKTVNAERMAKSGEEELTVSGYQVDALLQAAGVTDYSTVTLSAADGFSAEITKEEAQMDTTILAFSQEGEELAEDEIPMLTVDGGGGNMWVKGIVTIAAE